MSSRADILRRIASRLESLDETGYDASLAEWLRELAAEFSACIVKD
jgi:hypothetical protein